MPDMMRLSLLTLAVLTAFAGNSVLARLALADGAIDPWSFTALRLISGALMLLLLAGASRVLKHGSAAGALWLLVYALLFSLAYIDLAAGTGALILFAAVQVTMIAGGLKNGERISTVQAAGLLLAGAGLFVLMKPGLERPSISGAAMMTAAGIGWGLYSLRGKSAGDALGATAGNFARAALLIAPITLTAFAIGRPVVVTQGGVILAISSGVITSALGYALWYYVLKNLRAITASASQLSVPLLAASGGMLFLSEPITAGFAVSALLVLAGLGLVILPAGER